jgi:flagellar biosynthesis/type III secretory pathway M-ring protein FliF/YscJ
MSAEDGTMALPGQETAAQLQQKAINQQVETAKDLASKDPKRVAQVVRNWVGEE